MIQNVIFGILFVKILFWYTTFLCLSRRSSGHHQSFFLISDFLAESFKANKKYQERSHILQYSFAQKSSLILPTSTHLIFKILCSRNTAKKLSDFINFQQICFCLVSENIFILHYFLTPKNCIFESH